MLYWEEKNFVALTTKELYAILALRARVFIVEQNSCYLDADGQDTEAFHVCGWADSLKNELVAYARILPPSTVLSALRFGRVAVSETYRGQGYAKQLIRRIFGHIQQQAYKTSPIAISAQEYLVDFYQKFGFNPSGHCYNDANVPHVDMQRESLAVVPFSSE